MGAGKSVVGRRLAEALGWGFVDTDVEVERTTGRTVTQLFAEDGEPGFRKAEAAAVADAVARPNVVIALGGGAVETPAVVETLWTRCRVVYLRATEDTLRTRLSGETDGRPLLAGGISFDRLPARRPLYERAHHIVDTDDLGPDDVVALILQAARP